MTVIRIFKVIKNKNIMAGKFLSQIFLFLFILSFVGIRITRTSPLYSLSDSGKFGVQNRVVVAEVEKPMNAVLESVMDLGGNIMVLIPQKDFEKRDPIGPDLGTARSYSGQRTAKIMWGQLASNSPTGPGRRKRNSTDKERTALRRLDG